MFWKNHGKLRAVLILLFFVAGLALTLAGWRLTGQLTGLGLMFLGIAFLLTALFLYNQPYA